MSRSTLTLSLSPDTITKAKILAAQRKTSLSRLFADCIEDLERRDCVYQSARRRALTHLKRGFDLGAQPTTREELHARSRLR
jgi:predicted transcriptional regulator